MKAEQRTQEEWSWKFSMCKSAQSILMIISKLDEWRCFLWVKVSKSPGGHCEFPLKLFHGTFSQICYLSTGYTLVNNSSFIKTLLTETILKEWRGGLQYH